MHRDHILIKAKGQVLIIAIIFLAVILILTATMFSKVSSFLRFGNISAQASQATALAEAGVDNTVWLLNTNGGNCPAACTTETTLGTIGTFKVTVVENSPNLKTITSTGYVPGSTNPKSKRTVKVQVGIDSTIIAFNYAAQTGEGGALMNQSSTIEGSIYSNGSISKGDGNGQHITGNAYAVGAIDSGILIDGSINPGASPAPYPEVNYADWKDEVTNHPSSQTINCSTDPSSCDISSSTSIGFIKYIGDLTISNNAIVTMTGPIWVSKDDLGNGGNFTMTQGGTTLELDSQFGSNSTVLIIDGVASLNQGGQFLSTSASPPGYIMLVTTSTADPAIDLSQSAATAIFYALEGSAVLSQTADVTALVAYKVTMSNSATLHYSTGLAGASFVSDYGGSWQIKKGTYKQTGSP